MTGKQFRAWRNKLGYNRKQMAAEFHVDRATIRNWEEEPGRLRRMVELACKGYEAERAA